MGSVTSKPRASFRSLDHSNQGRMMPDMSAKKETNEGTDALKYVE